MKFLRFCINKILVRVGVFIIFLMFEVVSFNYRFDFGIFIKEIKKFFFEFLLFKEEFIN